MKLDDYDDEKKKKDFKTRKAPEEILNEREVEERTHSKRRLNSFHIKLISSKINKFFFHTVAKI